MSIFHPHYIFKRIYEIPTDFFQEKGIRALLLDVDNTLTTDNSPTPHEEVLAWLDAQRRAGLRLLVFSNNSEERVAPFAEGLGLEYIAGAAKPLPGNIRKALSSLGLGKKDVAIIGDQIFTDILCGRMVGCTAIWVEPMAMEGYGFFKVKRFLEKGILRRYRKRKNRRKV